MFDAGPLHARCYCRNPACRQKLPRPVADKRDAFCDVQCQFRYSQFNCPVCDKPLLKSDRQKRKRFCSERCKSTYHRNSARFERPFSGPARGMAGATRSPPKSPEISTAISDHFGGQPLRKIPGEIGPNAFHCATVPDGPDCQWEGGSYERTEAREPRRPRDSQARPRRPRLADRSRRRAGQRGRSAARSSAPRSNPYDRVANLKTMGRAMTEPGAAGRAIGRRHLHHDGETR